MTRPTARATGPGGDGGRPGSTGWYRITNVAGPAAGVWLYDEVGAWGVTASDFVKELQDLRVGEIELHINSPGGEVFDGMAIFNALRNHRATINVIIDGIAASAASFIAMAGDHIAIEPNGTIMIHDGQGICVGDSADMRKLADLLDKCSDNIAGIYAERAGGSVADWRGRMRAETWYNAKEAKAAGLVDAISRPADRGTVRDDWDLSVFRFAGRRNAPAPGVDPVRNQQTAVTAMACPSHDTATTEGTWDAGTQEGRLPSPMPMASAKKMYGWYDMQQVAEGMMPKAAGKLPHHEVSADGTPGAANLAGVRNALARLGQSDIPDADQDAVRAHLRAHLAAGQQPSDHAHVEPTALVGEGLRFDPDAFRAAMVRAAELPFDAGGFRDAMQSVAALAPAPPTAPLQPIDLGPPPPPPAEPEPPSPWDAIREAVQSVAGSAPAPPPPTFRPVDLGPELPVPPPTPPDPGAAMARQFREAMQTVAGSAPAPPTAPPQPIDLGPPLPEPVTPPTDEPEASPWDIVRAAMTVVANTAPAPPEVPQPDDDPADEPVFLMDADAFRAALRRANSE